MQGCDGGNAYVAYTYAASAGLQRASSYPTYSPKRWPNGTCDVREEKVVARISGYESVATTEDGLKEALVNKVGRGFVNRPIRYKLNKVDTTYRCEGLKEVTSLKVKY